MFCATEPFRPQRLPRIYPPKHRQRGVRCRWPHRLRNFRFFPDEWPDGLTYLENYIQEDEAERLVREIDAAPWRTDLKRRAQHYGYRYDYDEATGAAFYEVEIMLADGELRQLGDVTLLPGMPVEAYIRTQDRTPLAYLVQPLSAYFSRAFREG